MEKVKIYVGPVPNNIGPLAVERLSTLKEGDIDVNNKKAMLDFIIKIAEDAYEQAEDNEIVWVTDIKFSIHPIINHVSKTLEDAKEFAKSYINCFLKEDTYELTVVSTKEECLKIIKEEQSKLIEMLGLLDIQPLGSKFVN